MKRFFIFDFHKPVAMVKLVVLVLFYFLFPLVIIWMCRHWIFFKKLGSIVLAYGFGLLISALGILPRGSDAYREALKGESFLPAEEAHALFTSGVISDDDIMVNTIGSTQDALQAVGVLAFPLLLFSLNIRRWIRHAKEGFISMALAFISIIVVIVTGYLFFRTRVPDAWQIGGMLVGVYTGGTPNMVSLKIALDVDPSSFIMANTYDMVVGAITIIFFITAGPRVFRSILRPFKKTEGASGEPVEDIRDAESFEDYSGMFRKGVLVKLFQAFGLAVIILILSVGISMLLFGSIKDPVVILSITTLSIIASLFTWVNRIEKTFQLGMYFVLVFSLLVASMADFSAIFSLGMLNLLAFITWCYFGSLLLHLLLSVIFRVNADDYLITTTAFVFSPPFVPVVAASLKNKDVIITGITVGIIGYVAGNYLGVALGYFMQGL
ncbi:MAG TPA: DUF819 family protein [Bacteroidales bacterium]|nr:DUF819 family protein [Bacteroidales bacterium]HPJ58483.1 DUF819 family protein [Bacteroidales bacterium]HRW85018.1 DUF819 family protein [Bacteroidales bacterium]